MKFKTYFLNLIAIATVISVFGFTMNWQLQSVQYQDLSSHTRDSSSSGSKFWYQDFVPPNTQNDIENELSFKDVTAAAGLPIIYGLTIAIGDYNNDQKPDLLAGGKLFRNLSTFSQIQLQDVTVESQLGTLKGFPSWVDLNNDGRLDIVSTSGQVLVQNSQGQFVESAQILNLAIPQKAYTLSFVDLNQDSWIDILVGLSENHQGNSFTFEKSVAFINLQGKRFRSWEEYGFKSLPPTYVRGIVWVDYNRDRRPDGYFSNYRLRPNYLLSKTSLGWTNVAHFSGVAGEHKPNMYFDQKMQQSYGPTYGHTIGSVWADFNNDGLFDLWSSNLVHKFVGQGQNGYDIRGYVCDDSKIYKNMGPPFYRFQNMRDTSQIPLMPMGDWSKYKGDELWAHSTSGDFDNDGKIDIYVSQVYNLKYAYSLLFKNLGNFKFKHLSRGQSIESYDGYGGAWVDLNGDGLLDLINSGRPMVDAPSQVRIFKNEIANGNDFLKVKLHPGASGKNPITTQVAIYHEDGVLLRQVEGVTGTLNQQNDPTLHFGLGKNIKIKVIEIRWSSGRTTYIKNSFKLNSTLHVTEP